MSDLNIIVYEDGHRTPDHEVMGCIKKAFKLGYHTIALNVIISDTELSGKNGIPSPIKYDIPDMSAKEARSQGKTLQVLTRLSAKVSENAQAHKLQQSPVSKEYDLIAAHPTSEGLLNSLINSGGIDIIYYPLQENISLPKYNSISFAIQKGILLELVYTSLMDERRLTALRQMRHLVHREKSGFIFSSGASSSEKMRSPLDVSFMGYLLDFNAESSRSCVWDGPNSVVVHGETRRRKTRGVVIALMKESVPEGERWLIEECKVGKRKRDE